jgi:hypothetical protein
MSSLDDTFEKVVELFNSQDPDGKLIDYFDENIVLQNIKGHEYYTGAKAVYKYLQTEQWPVKPRFNPDPSTTKTVLNGNGKAATIQGTAAWHDDDGDTDGPIRYVFNFINKNDDWLVSTLWGSQD